MWNEDNRKQRANDNMTHGEKKITKIIEELTLFFFSVGADRIRSGINKDGNEIKITMQAKYDSEYKGNLHSLEEYLNEPKNEAMEDYYWELAGSGDPGESNQLLLVGMMIDKAEVTIENNQVSLVLYKTMDEL